MRQTTYTREEAFEELKKYNGDVQMVLREYLDYESKANPIVTGEKTTNQKIFSEIRGFMDTAIQGYNQRKEHEEHMKEVHTLCGEDATKLKKDD